MKKRLVFIVLLVCCLFLGGCSEKEDNNVTNNKDFIHMTLKINMPLNFDDLDSYFEFPLSEVLESNNIGSIEGDGTPIGDYGPYATDIEFEIYKDKREEFKKLINEYEFPKGSYLEIDGEESYPLDNSNNLVGIRLEFKNLSDKRIEKIYSELSNLNNNYKYKTLINYSGDRFIFYYSDNMDSLKDDFNKYIEKNNYKNKIKIISMPEVIVELR